MIRKLRVDNPLNKMPQVTEKARMLKRGRLQIGSSLKAGDNNDEKATFDTPMYDEEGSVGEMVTRFERDIPHSTTASTFEAEVDMSQPRRVQ